MKAWLKYRHKFDKKSQFTIQCITFDVAITTLRIDQCWLLPPMRLPVDNIILQCINYLPSVSTVLLADKVAGGSEILRVTHKLPNALKLLWNCALKLVYQILLMAIL